MLQHVATLRWHVELMAIHFHGLNGIEMENGYVLVLENECSSPKKSMYIFKRVDSAEKKTFLL